VRETNAILVLVGLGMWAMTIRQRDKANVHKSKQKFVKMRQAGCRYESESRAKEKQRSMEMRCRRSQIVRGDVRGPNTSVGDESMRTDED
jgi:hypothetical protein